MKEYIVKVHSNRTEWFNKEGQRHREDGPAREWVDGSKQWWLNGVLHRENGPAIEDVDVYKAWWVNGVLHREDGPAIEYPDGTRSWWLNGVKCTEEEFLEMTQPIEEMTMEQVCKALGKIIKIVK